MKFETPEQYLQHIIDTEKIEEIPCSKCDGDCCGPVEFSAEQLEYIFTKYSKEPEFKKRFKASSNSKVSSKLLLFYKMTNGIIPRFKKTNQYVQAGIKSDSCIFKKDEEVGSNHCMIYEDRPLICKAYGTKTICCPYQGLKEQPTGFAKLQLIYGGHQLRQNNMIRAFTDEQ